MTKKELKKIFKSKGFSFFRRIQKIDEYWEAFGEQFLFITPEEIIEKLL